MFPVDLIHISPKADGEWWLNYEVYIPLKEIIRRIIKGEKMSQEVVI